MDISWLISAPVKVAGTGAVTVAVAAAVTIALEILVAGAGAMDDIVVELLAALIPPAVGGIISEEGSLVFAELFVLND